MAGCCSEVELNLLRACFDMDGEDGNLSGEYEVFNGSWGSMCLAMTAILALGVGGARLAG